MNKFEKYVLGIEESLQKVDDAVESGAYLTKMEVFDYNFKSVLGKVGKNKSYMSDMEYRASYFYAKFFKRVMELKQCGYTFEDVEKLFKVMCSKAMQLRLSYGKSVYCWNRDGFVYVEVKNKSESVHTFVIGERADLCKASLVVLTYFATDRVKDIELKSFMETYLMEVFNNIVDGQKPEPYIYKGLAKSLKNELKKIDTKKDVKKEDDSEKVIQFKAV